ncbi:hypothetical protein [Sutcliffiella cohnii]|uniref:hypothetical protein n=1 Tax=Sutcliffiella cohnii TaxID=33932 RepID=UPI0012ED3747|nr:hypothetical protein [Sutcliffiella cohnii]
MTFSGQAARSNLYTNKLFTGSSSYKIQMSNSYSTQLKVELYKKGFWYDSLVTTYYVTPGYTRYGYPSGLDHSADYYLLFYAPSNFSGYVEY